MRLVQMRSDHIEGFCIIVDSFNLDYDIIVKFTYFVNIWDALWLLWHLTCEKHCNTISDNKKRDKLKYSMYSLAYARGFKRVKPYM